MARPRVTDRSTMLAISLPMSLQERIRAFIEKNPQFHFTVSGFIREAATRLLDANNAEVVIIEEPIVEQLVRPPLSATRDPSVETYNAGLPPGMTEAQWKALLGAPQAPVVEPAGSTIEMLARHVAKPKTREELRAEFAAKNPGFLESAKAQLDEEKAESADSRFKRATEKLQ